MTEFAFALHLSVCVFMLIRWRYVRPLSSRIYHPSHKPPCLFLPHFSWPIKTATPPRLRVLRARHTVGADNNTYVRTKDVARILIRGGALIPVHVCVCTCLCASVYVHAYEPQIFEREWVILPTVPGYTFSVGANCQTFYSERRSVRHSQPRRWAHTRQVHLRRSICALLL